MVLDRTSQTKPELHRTLSLSACFVFAASLADTSWWLVSGMPTKTKNSPARGLLNRLVCGFLFVANLCVCARARARVCVCVWVSELIFLTAVSKVGIGLRLWHNVTMSTIYTLRFCFRALHCNIIRWHAGGRETQTTNLFACRLVTGKPYEADSRTSKGRKLKGHVCTRGVRNPGYTRTSLRSIPAVTFGESSGRRKSFHYMDHRDMNAKYIVPWKPDPFPKCQTYDDREDIFWIQHKIIKYLFIPFIQRKRNGSFLKIEILKNTAVIK